jgi:3-deoxy-D-manno-octulosonate 8-phosphate phosphatase KdsC-like HAD superfamily phosphatase
VEEGVQHRVHRDRRGYREEKERKLARGRKKIPRKLAKKAKQILVVLMDVDGTLTDGSVTLLSQSDGSALEVKTFDAHDGQGLTLAVTAGLRTGVISGRSSAALRRRCKELDVEFVYEKQGH